MSVNTWQISNRGVAGVPATAAQTCPSGSAGFQVRLRALQASLSGPNSGADQLEVLDGASVILTLDASIVANGAALVSLGPIDLRASPGNTLTVQWVSGVGGNYEDVNAQGDFVSTGYPYGMS